MFGVTDWGAMTERDLVNSVKDAQAKEREIRERKKIADANAKRAAGINGIARIISGLKIGDIVKMRIAAEEASESDTK